MATSERRMIWDLPVRLTHVGLIVAIAGSWISHYAGAEYFVYHEWCGYTSLVLAVFRVIWGFVGTRHARFSDFLRGPRELARHIRGVGEFGIGHNPLGGLMIVVLLALVIAQGLTGLFANDQIINTGPLYSYAASLSDRLTAWHIRIAWVLAAAIGIHLGAALFYLWIKKQDLITPIVTGRNSNPHLPIGAGIKSSRIALAAAIVAALAAVLWYVISRAPSAELLGL